MNERPYIFGPPLVYLAVFDQFYHSAIPITRWYIYKFSIVEYHVTRSVILRVFLPCVPSARNNILPRPIYRRA